MLSNTCGGVKNIKKKKTNRKINIQTFLKFLVS